MTSSALALVLLLSQVPSAPLPSSNEKRTIDPVDEEVLNASFLDAKAETLLEFFRLRCSRTADAEVLDQLFTQLGDDDESLRRRAARTLVGLGAVASPTLRRAANDAPHRTRTELATKCLRLLEGTTSTDVQVRALRVLGVHRPEGLSAVLLGYLPLAENEEIVEQIVRVLSDLDGMRDTPDPTIVEALSDPVPIRRIVASAVLASRTDIDELFRPLLQDPKATVRKKVALTLARHHHKEAIPVLIDLLAELPGESRAEIEDYLIDLAGEWAVRTPSGEGRVSQRLRRELWLGWWQEITGEVLLSELRTQTPSDQEYLRIAKRIEELGSRDAKIRDAAFADLQAGGVAAASLLRKALDSDNANVRTKAAECLELLEDSLQPVPLVAIRMLSLREPEGALQALLAYYPFANEVNDQEEIRKQIGLLGFENSEPDPTLVRALGDALAPRRTVAGVTLCRWGNKRARSLVKPLLSDPSLTTRMHIAIALVRSGERSPVEELIDLLPKVSGEQAYQIEDFLTALADDKGPQTTFTEDPKSRIQSRDLWADWWKREKGQVDLSRVAEDQSSTGKYIVIESYNATTRTGRVLQLDRRGNAMWEIGNLKYPMYAHLFASNRLLIAEQSMNRVTERDLEGKILQTFPLSSANYCKRLRNGHTFLSNRQTIQEVDAKGKVIFTTSVPGKSILAIEKFPNGDLAYVTYQGTYTRLDAKGKTIKEFNVPFNTRTSISGGQVLPRDRVLISTSRPGSVAEYDEKGKIRWQVEVNLPLFPTRLRNGNTLVIGNSGADTHTVNRSGKVIATKKNDGYRAYRILAR